MSSKYASSHVSPAGPGDARPTGFQIVEDEKLPGALDSQTILITGCSGGIGVETARALALTGAKLFLTARDLKKAREVLSDILLSGRVELLHLDLTSLASVRSCADEFLEKSQGRLNILICNAGVMRVPSLIKTVDGFETQFGTNHLAHFLLFQLLKSALLSSATPNTNSRVVMVSSSAHRYSEIKFGNMNFDNGGYDSAKAYGQSKLANIYMANSIERHYGERGVHGLSLHPGVIFTELYKYIDSQSTALLEKDEFKAVMKSSKQGAATTVFAAVARELEGKGRIYLENCMISRTLEPEARMLDFGYETHAFDEVKEEKLWNESLKMVGMEED